MLGYRHIPPNLANRLCWWWSSLSLHSPSLLTRKSLLLTLAFRKKRESRESTSIVFFLYLKITNMLKWHISVWCALNSTASRSYMQMFLCREKQQALPAKLKASLPHPRHSTKTFKYRPGLHCQMFEVFASHIIQTLYLLGMEVPAHNPNTRGC